MDSTTKISSSSSSSSSRSNNYDDRKRRLDVLTSLLQKRNLYPKRTRNKIDKLVNEFLNKTKDNNPSIVIIFDDDGNNDDEDDDEDEAEQQRRLKLLLQILIDFSYLVVRTQHNLVEEFLNETRNDVHYMICDNNGDDDEYRGLDSDRDTVQEVEAILRVFPDIISRRDDEGEYPIQCLTRIYCHINPTWQCNCKAVAFVPIVVELAIEFGSFNEELRGRLLIQDYYRMNILENLTESISYNFESDADADADADADDNDNDNDNDDDDDKYLLVLKQLRQMGHLKKEDIKEFSLLEILCFQQNTEGNRFKFLIEWDPTSLTHRNEYGCLPLHVTTYNDSDDIRAGFQLVFEYGILYYPTKKGIHLLFEKDNVDGNTTPYQMACKKWGHKQVIYVVEDILVLDSSQRRTTSSYLHSKNDNNNNNNTNTCNTGGPYNIIDSFLSAAIDENIHLDCVYFLLRREPDVIAKLLSPSSAATVETGEAAAPSAMFDSNNNNNNNSKNDNDSGQRKRKRRS